MVIQHSLPHYFEYVGECGLNVGITYMETVPTPYLWKRQCSYMDLILSSDEDMSDALHKSGINNEIIPVPCDTSKYDKDIGLLPSIKNLKESGDFVFYTMGEMVQRKNLYALLKAFFSEFREDEPVKLVIKTSLGGIKKEQLFQTINNDVAKIRSGMLLPPSTQQIVFLGSWLSEDEVLQFHKSCDCFIQVSHGEGFSLPAFDAMAMGNTPIVSNIGGYKNYINNDTGWLVNCRQTVCFGETPHYPELFNGVTQTWADPDLLQLKQCMREAYSQKNRAAKVEFGKKQIRNFSYQSIGTKMAEVLEKYVKQKREMARLT